MADAKKYFYDFNISPHSLRRSFATYLNKQGMNIQLIQRQLGHSNINTTYLYIHNNKDEIVNAYNKYMLNK
ncbi:site-specific integrase [Mycoplasmopsis felis]|uniref:site-specific integrase n=1 Tax=Mycoplasmopsis felis TaxID=33923 RepID=UPI002FF05373